MKEITDLILANSFSPYKGGISRYLRGIADRLSKHKNIAVVTRVDSTDKSIEGYDVIRSIGYRSILFINKIVHCMLCINIFIVNMDSVKRIYAGAAVPYGLLCILFKFMKPSLRIYVFTYGSELLWEGRKTHALIRNFVLRKSDIIITISKYSKGILQSITRKPIVIAAPGYDGEFYVKDHNDGKKVKLLTVAALTRRKGQHLVIEALNNLRNKLDFSYIIIGNGPREDDLRNLIDKYGIEDKIEVKTGLSDEEVHSYYSSSDIFIMPTFKDDYDIEGFGIVYLEAGAHSLPIIAAPVGGVVDIVENGVNGIYVREKNIGDIEKAILQLSESKALRKKMGDAAQMTAKSFTYENAVNNILKTFI